MPRPSRSLPAGHSFHITLRCNSRQFLIAKRIRRDVLLVVLEKAKQNYPFRLYGVCLMANRIHLLIKPDDASQLPKLMHWVKTTNGHSIRCEPFTPIQKQQECEKVFMTLIVTTGIAAD
jgi:REP element-mobilizing transposase RayT